MDFVGCTYGYGGIVRMHPSFSTGIIAIKGREYVSITPLSTNAMYTPQIPNLRAHISSMDHQPPNLIHQTGRSRSAVVIATRPSLTDNPSSLHCIYILCRDMDRTPTYFHGEFPRAACSAIVRIRSSCVAAAVRGWKGPVALLQRAIGHASILRDQRIPAEDRVKCTSSSLSDGAR